MNKNYLYLSRFLNRNLDASKEKCLQKQPATTSQYHLIYGGRYGMARHFITFWTQKTHYNEAYETPNMERLAQRHDVYTGLCLQHQFGNLMQRLDHRCQQRTPQGNQLDT